MHRLKGTNSHSAAEVFQLWNEFQPKDRTVQSCNQSCGIYTHLAIVQDHDPAAAHHCVETMGDDEGGAAAKCTANGLLDETVCLSVNGCCRLIQYKNLQKRRKKGKEQQMLPNNEGKAIKNKILVPVLAIKCKISEYSHHIMYAAHASFMF